MNRSERMSMRMAKWCLKAIFWLLLAWMVLNTWLGRFYDYYVT